MKNQKDILMSLTVEEIEARFSKKTKNKNK